MKLHAHQIRAKMVEHAQTTIITLVHFIAVHVQMVLREQIVEIVIKIYFCIRVVVFFWLFLMVIDN